MSRILVNIRGTNGSGKSTVPLAMMDDPKMRVVFFNRNTAQNPIAPYLTVFPTYGWVALGTYFNKTGGMDTIATTERMKEALAYAWTKYPQYDVLMEGIIASTIRSTYINLFTDYQRMVEEKCINPRKIIVLNFLPPLSVCVSRVKERNGGKPVKEDQIESKWNTVARNVAYFKEAGIKTLKFDNSQIEKQYMLPWFLRTMDKYRED